MLSSRTAMSRRDAKRARTLEFERIFERYAPYVAAIGIRMLGRDSELDDLVQDVFMEVHRSLHNVRDPEAIRGWIATIAVRKVQKRFRARRVKLLLGIASGHDYENILDESASPEETAKLKAAYRTLDQLPAKERTAWSLRHLQDETLDDIAVLMDCSVSTVQRLIRRAEKVIQTTRGRAYA